MNPELIRQLLRNQPFMPFEIHSSSGDVYKVRHPEQVLVAGNRLIIYYPENDQIAFCSFMHVANVLQLAASA